MTLSQVNVVYFFRIYTAATFVPTPNYQREHRRGCRLTVDTSGTRYTDHGGVKRRRYTDHGGVKRRQRAAPHAFGGTWPSTEYATWLLKQFTWPGDRAGTRWTAPRKGPLREVATTNDSGTTLDAPGLKCIANTNDFHSIWVSIPSFASLCEFPAPPSRRRCFATRGRRRGWPAGPPGGTPHIREVCHPKDERTKQTLGRPFE